MVCDIHWQQAPGQEWLRVASLFKLLPRICVLGRVTMCSLGVAQNDELSRWEWSSGLLDWLALEFKELFFSVASVNGVKLVAVCMGKGDDVQFGAQIWKLWKISRKEQHFLGIFFSATYSVRVHKEGRTLGGPFLSWRIGHRKSSLSASDDN